MYYLLYVTKYIGNKILLNRQLFKLIRAFRPSIGDDIHRHRSGRTYRQVDKLASDVFLLIAANSSSANRCKYLNNSAVSTTTILIV